MSRNLHRLSFYLCLWHGVMAAALAENVLIPAGASWLYLANGSDQGVAWRAPEFPAAGWQVGASRLGFGGDGESTVIGAAANGYTTFYFRRPFVIWNPSAVTNLITRLWRDDGAVLYINGSEALRCNMPATPVNHLTLALDTVGGGDETNFYFHRLNPALLVSGTNWLAAEVHQAEIGSSDIGFDLELVANPLQQSARVTAYIDARSRLRFRGTTVQWHHLSAAAPGRHSSTNNATFVNEAAWYPTWPDSPDRQNRDCNCLSSVFSGHEIHLPLTNMAVRMRQIGGRGSFRMIQMPEALNSYTTVVELNDGSSGAAWLGAYVDFAVAHPLIPFRAAWKYYPALSAPGPGWELPGFVDSAWIEGVGQFGFGEGDEQTVVVNPAAATHYFRKVFQVTELDTIGVVTLTLLRDDGAIVYLNGSEVMRSNMPQGPVNYATPASSAISGSDEEILVQTTIPRDLLMEGSNVVAVEIHQTASTSDMSFDLRLDGDVVDAGVPSLTVGTWNENVTLAWPARFADYTLQSSPQVSVGWNNVLKPFVTSNGLRIVTLPLDSDARFFRLVR